jgi:hypothetical protein
MIYHDQLSKNMMLIRHLIYSYWPVTGMHDDGERRTWFLYLQGRATTK